MRGIQHKVVTHHIYQLSTMDSEVTEVGPALKEEASLAPIVSEATPTIVLVV